MDVLNVFIGAIHVFASIFLIAFVLLHSGKGSGLSDMFGGGGALAGSAVAERNLDRITVFTVVVFTFTTIFLGIQLG